MKPTSLMVMVLLRDVTSHNSFVLLHKVKPRESSSWQKDKYNLPGGHVEPNENVINAVIRETREETGIKLGRQHFDHRLTMICRDGNVYIYQAFTKIMHLDGYGNDKEHLFIADLQHMPDNCLDNLCWIIPLMMDEALKVPLTIEYDLMFKVRDAIGRAQ